jgi:hypothetical protein
VVAGRGLAALGRRMKHQEGGRDTYVAPALRATLVERLA